MSGTELVILIVVPLIVAIIVLAILVAQMKSVHKQSADNYITEGGLHLTSRNDVYTHTTTTRTKISNNSNK